MFIKNKQAAHNDAGHNGNKVTVVKKATVVKKLTVAKKATVTKKATCLALCLNLIGYCAITPALAQSQLPAGLELDRVVEGDVAIDNINSRVTDINQASDSAIIDWRSFSIDANEAVNFNQPSTSSVALNRVTGSNESQILGALNANGLVFLVNPNGILFGQDATVDVAGLVATTSDIDNDDFLAGRYQFAEEASLQSHVANHGSISVRDGGLVALVAPGVENSGTIYAQLGRVNLASGTAFTLDLYGDQLIQLALDSHLADMAEDAMGSSTNNLSIENSGIDHSGAIYANGGTVVLDSRAAASAVDSLINMSGVVQAQSIAEIEGQILLTGSNVQITGVLDASGKQATQSGGTIEVFGEAIQATNDAFLDVSGAGSGGFIELSAATVNIDAVTNLNGGNGSGGTLLIDPVDLAIDTAAGTDVVTVSTIETALASGGDFIAEAEQSISVNASIDTSAQTTSGTLSLNDENSDGVLTVNLNQQIVLGANQSLNGEASFVNVADGTSIQNGVDVASTGATVNVAVGSYNESVSIDKSVTLNGAQAGVDARGRSATESALTGSISVETGVSGLLIDGLSIAEGAATSGSNAGIVIKNNATDITIQNTIFSRSGTVDGDTYRGIVTFSGGNQTGLLIQNNHFSGWATGIFLNPKATGAQILNNNFDGNFVGMSVDGPGGTLITGNLFANNLFEGLGIGPGESSPSVDLSANLFESNATHIGLYIDIELDAAANTFDGTSASAMTIEQLLVAAEKIGDGTSSSGGYSGLVSLRDNYLLVTTGQSINNAIDLASIGDTVAVGAGTYSEAVVVDKSITLSGIAGTLISLDGSLPLGRIVNVTAGNVTVDGFSIEGGGTHVGISIPGQNATVSNNQISNVLTGIQTNTLNTEGNNTITGNMVSNSGYGISLQNNSNVVTGNTIDVTTEGFGIGSANNTITGNNLRIGSSGVHLQTYSLAPLPGADIDLQAFLDNNQFDRALYITDGSNISVQTIFGNIQNTIDAASSGETVNMLDGTYNLSSTLNINKDINLVGASETNTIIDGSAVSGYGLYVTADDASLSDFTLYGPSADSGNSYGIKVNPDTSDATDRLTDFSIANVSIRGSGRAELDLNGVNGAVINNVTADGRSLSDETVETAGAGIQITDSANITLTNVETLGNAWGGVALYQANRFYDQQTSNININAASNTFNESAGLFSQDSSDSLDFGNLNLSGFDHTVRNADFRSDGDQFTFYQVSDQAAIDFALSLDSPFSSVIQGWSGTTNTNSFTVGTSTDGTIMNIGNVAAAAPNGATINVAQGTYNENIALNGDKTFIFNNVTLTSLSAQNGSTIELGGSLSLSSLSFFAAINLADDLTITADQGIALSSVDGAHSLNLAASSVELASAGSSTALVSLDIDSDSISVGNISTTGVQSYTGDVVLNGSDYTGGEFNLTGASQLSANTSINSTGSTLFGGAINGAFDLIIGAGSVGLGNVGDTTALNSLQVTADTIETGNVETSGAQNYIGSLILNGSSYSTASLDVTGTTQLTADTNVSSTGAINFADDINGGFSLVLDGSEVALDDVGTSTPLASLDVTAGNIAVGSVSSTGAQGYQGALTLQGSSYQGSSATITGATQLAADASINMSGAIDFSDDINGAFDLSLNGSSANLADAGDTTALNSLNIQASTIALGNINTTSDQSYTGTVTLNGSDYTGGSFNVVGTSVLVTNVSVDTSSSNGSILFSDDIDGTVEDAQNLTLNAGTGSVTHGDLGQAVRIGDLTVTAGNYDGSAGTSDVVNLIVNAGDISVGNSTVNAIGLVSMFGASITGSINANEVQLQAEETLSATIVATEVVNVSAQNVAGTSITAETVEIEATESVEADVTATQTANINANNVSNTSIEAENVSIVALQSLEALINAAQTVDVQAQNVSNTSIDASNVNIEATENVEADVIATQTASINANNVFNTNIEAVNVSIAAVESVEAQINATQTVDVQAQNVSNTNIDAGQVTISATENVEVEVNATNKVAIQADNVNATVSAPNASIEAEQSIEVAGDIDNLTVATDGEVSISGDVGSVEFDSGDVDINGSSLDNVLATSVIALDTLLILAAPENPDSASPAYFAFSQDSVGDPFASDFAIGSLTTPESSSDEEDSKKDEDEQEEQLNKFLQGSWTELTKKTLN